jgi:hypothetical protein
METYTDAADVERCDRCEEEVGECPCTCVECGDSLEDCTCEEGPS